MTTDVFHRTRYAQEMAQQLLHPTAFQLNVRSGVFLSGIRRIGKTTFLKQDLIPALEADGALVIYVDLWAERSRSPLALVYEAVQQTLGQFQTPGSGVLERLKGLNLGGLGFSFGFQLDSVGASGGTTLAQAFQELIDKAGINVVLIVDEVQQALVTEDGYNLLHALKAARDAVNARPNTRGYFLFLGTGSHKSLVTDMATRRSQPFMGAMTTAYEPLAEDFVEWKLKQLASTPGRKLPSLAVTLAGFQTMGNRPEELLKALVQLQSTSVSADEAFPIICATLASAAADVELQMLDELGPLGEAMFTRIAEGPESGVTGLYGADSLEFFTKSVNALVEATQVQNLVEKMIAANLITRSGHGVYVVADPFVRKVWLSRQSLNQRQRGRAASHPLIWMLIVAAVVSAAWWYPTWRELITPDPTASGAAGGPGSRGSGGGAAAWRMGGGRAQPVSVGEVRQLSVRQTVSAIGTLTALNTAVVRAKVDGELKALRFTEGQMVEAGALLAEIDPRNYETQLAQAKGQLERDAAQMRNAQLDLKRYRDLLAQDAIARQQVDTQEALVKQLQGTVQADQAQVDNAALLLSYTRVTAPISGRLGLKQAELGSLVRAGDAAGLVTITQTQPMAVLFAVPEVHVPLIQRKLREGQALPVQAWDREMKEPLAEGQVTTTDNAIDLSTGTLKLKALLDNRNGALFPNQFANIRLQLDTLKDRLAVPATAVLRGSAGTFVVVALADGTAQIRRVQLEAVDGDWQAVQGDLKPGERVVTDGADRLRDGSRVEVVTTVSPPLPTESRVLGAAVSAPTKPVPVKPGPNKAGADKANADTASTGTPSPGTPSAADRPAGERPRWMDRLPPEVAEKVKNMSPEERRAFFQKMRERNAQQGQ